jgi:hypothetical protein
MTFGVPVTLGVLLLFVLVAIVPPRLPLIVRLLIQIVAGLGIYFGLRDAEFTLPMADSLPMSSLFGGDGGMGEFNKYAMGVVAPVLGILFSLIVAGIRKVTRKSEE